MDAPSPPPEQVMKFINALTISRVLLGACDAVLVWEWLTLIPVEYRYIWRSEIRFTTVIFILLRYCTFAAMGVFTWLFFWDGSEALCRRMIPWLQIGPTIVLALANTLVAVRLYALYDKDKRIVTLLGAILLAQIGTQVWGSTQIRAQPQVTPLINSCLPHIQENFAVSWTLPMCFDTLALAFAVAKLTKIWRAGGQSRLVRVLIRDQVLWFLLIEAISIVNLLVAYATPGPLGSGGRGIVSSVLTTLTSISVCRIVLNIRQTAEEDKRNALLQVSASDNRTGLFPLTKPQNRGNAGSVEPQIPGAPSFRMNLYSSRDVDQQDSLEKGRQVPFDSNDDDGRDVEVRDDKPAVEDQFKKGYAL